MLAIFTMRPRSFLISGKNTFVTSMSPQRLTSATCLYSSIVCHSIGPILAIPALLMTPQRPAGCNKILTRWYSFVLTATHELQIVNILIKTCPSAGISCAKKQVFDRVLVRNARVFISKLGNAYKGVVDWKGLGRTTQFSHLL